MPVSTGIRNCQSLAAQNNILSAADHDFTKLSLILSVIFLVSIPKDILGEFYSGKVFYLLKTLFLNQVVLFGIQLNFIISSIQNMHIVLHHQFCVFILMVGQTIDVLMVQFKLL